MITRRNRSDKKEQLIVETIENGIYPGATVFVENEKYRVLEIENDIVTAIYAESYRRDKTPKKFKIEKCQINTFDVGANPFPKNDWNRKVRNVGFQLESIICNLFRDDVTGRQEYIVNGHVVHETNFNPYVVINGEKYYYQRPLIWTLEDKQNLIESIYLGISCGQILVREHGWQEVENAVKNGDYEMCFFDVVDGKQRLNTIYEFIRGDFPDKHGNYYGDLSDHAQIDFGNSMCLTYSVMGTDSTDEDVISAFLGVNFTGVPQSKEHIDYVRSIYDKFTDKS